MHDWDADGADPDNGAILLTSAFRAMKRAVVINDWCQDQGLLVEFVWPAEHLEFHTHSRRAFNAVVKRWGSPNNERSAFAQSDGYDEFYLIDGLVIEFYPPQVVYAKHEWVDPRRISFRDATGNEITMPADGGIFNFGTGVENEEGTENARAARIRWLADNERLPIHRYVRISFRTVDQVTPRDDRDDLDCAEPGCRRDAAHGSAHCWMHRRLFLSIGGEDACTHEKQADWPCAVPDCVEAGTVDGIVMNGREYSRRQNADGGWYWADLRIEAAQRGV